MHVLRVVAALAWLGPWLACESGEVRPETGAFSSLVVEVSNQNAHDVDIYLVRDNERMRVAYLWAGETGDLEIGPPLLEGGDFMLEAYASGLGATYRTSPITAVGTTHVHLHIDQNFFASTFSVGYGSEPDSLPPTGETT